MEINKKIEDTKELIDLLKEVYNKLEPYRNKMQYGLVSSLESEIKYATLRLNQLESATDCKKYVGKYFCSRCEKEMCLYYIKDVCDDGFIFGDCTYVDLDNTDYLRFYTDSKIRYAGWDESCEELTKEEYIRISKSVYEKYIKKLSKEE